MADFPVPAEGTVQVASEQSLPESLRKKHQFQNQVRLLLQATRWLRINMQKTEAFFLKKQERKEALDGIRRLRARLSLQTQVLRTWTQTARMCRTETHRHHT